MGALRKMALERQQDLHEQEEEKKREAAQMTMREMNAEVSGVSWPAGDRDRAQRRASNTGSSCYPPVLPPTTSTAILPHPTSSYKSHFQESTLQVGILSLQQYSPLVPPDFCLLYFWQPSPTSSYPIKPQATPSYLVA